MAIRAAAETVPKEALKTFQSRDPRKDLEHFWRELEEWYRDSQTGEWLAPWEGFCFPGDAAFAEATFTGDASFADATFTGIADFEGTTFTGHADFAAATFTGNAHFTKATFTGGVDFWETTFNENAFFGKATFTGDAIFEETWIRPGFTGRGTVFTGHADFAEATFTGNAHFRKATFTEDASFRGATFTGGGFFGAVPFTGEVDFGGATFNWNASFKDAAFAGDALFEVTTFTGDASFGEATFAGKASFRAATFTGDASFEGATFTGKASFLRTIVVSGLLLQANVGDGGQMVFNEADSNPQKDSPKGAPRIRFGPMSLARVELRDLDAGQIRFLYAADIDKLSLIGDIKWKKRDRGPGYAIADEDDLGVLASVDERRKRAPEVERIYTAMRKNHEDRGDRVGAHGWYWAEMDLGRRHHQNRMMWLARNFYRWTSNYGLSAALPALWLAGIALIAFALYMTPWRGICPIVANQCSGWEGNLKVVLLAAFFQSPPAGVTLTGLLANVVWLFVRIFGAAMLVSIGLAFRNQVAR